MRAMHSLKIEHARTRTHTHTRSKATDGRTKSQCNTTCHFKTRRECKFDKAKNTGDETPEKARETSETSLVLKLLNDHTNTAVTRRAEDATPRHQLQPAIEQGRRPLPITSERPHEHIPSHEKVRRVRVHAPQNRSNALSMPREKSHHRRLRLRKIAGSAPGPRGRALQRRGLTLQRPATSATSEGAEGRARESTSAAAVTNSPRRTSPAGEGCRDGHP